jgi:hypothetical protein
MSHLLAKQDTVLAAASGCGASTLAKTISQELNRRGVEVHFFDLSSPQAVLEAVTRLHSLTYPPPKDGEVGTSRKHHEAAGTTPPAKVFIIDHAAGLPCKDLQVWLTALLRQAPHQAVTNLWVGALDARAINEKFHVPLYSVPKSHITFPILSRDEALGAYRAIGEANDCDWGEAILYLLLDLCGNDLSLVRGAAEYLYGDWRDNLYDINVWDQLSNWLEQDPRVDQYRTFLHYLPDASKRYLDLIQIGGKPLCLRQDLREEVNTDLRRLVLRGFLVHNLLPGFYQLRNLTIRFLLQEPFKPNLLFRRAANERVAQLLQDVETMLRGALFHVFGNLEETDVRELLEKKQGEREFMPADLNKELLEWAIKQGGPDLRDQIGDILSRHRLIFKAANSVWARVTQMMQAEEPEVEGQPVPEHLRAIEYLTFGELGELLLALFDRVFPSLVEKPAVKAVVKQRWQESIAKVRRLRNLVAHLRNVAFQDMEDLVVTVESLRKDLIEFAGWR